MLIHFINFIEIASYVNLIFAVAGASNMGCPPVREDNLRALVSGLSYVQADNLRYNYFVPPTSV